METLKLQSQLECHLQQCTVLLESLSELFLREESLHRTSSSEDSSNNRTVSCQNDGCNIVEANESETMTEDLNISATALFLMLRDELESTQDSVCNENYMSCNDSSFNSIFSIVFKTLTTSTKESIRLLNVWLAKTLMKALKQEIIYTQELLSNESLDRFFEVLSIALNFLKTHDSLAVVSRCYLSLNIILERLAVGVDTCSKRYNVRSDDVLVMRLLHHGQEMAVDVDPEGEIPSQVTEGSFSADAIIPVCFWNHIVCIPAGTGLVNDLAVCTSFTQMYNVLLKSKDQILDWKRNSDQKLISHCNYVICIVVTLATQSSMIQLPSKILSLVEQQDDSMDDDEMPKNEPVNERYQYLKHLVEGYRVLQQRLSAEADALIEHINLSSHEDMDLLLRYCKELSFIERVIDKRHRGIWKIFRASIDVFVQLTENGIVVDEWKDDRKKSVVMENFAGKLTRIEEVNGVKSYSVANELHIRGSWDDHDSNAFNEKMKLLERYINASFDDQKISLEWEHHSRWIMMSCTFRPTVNGRAPYLAVMDLLYERCLDAFGVGIVSKCMCVL